MDTTIATAAEVAIIAAVVASGTQLVKQTKVPAQYMPLVAAVIGIISGLIAAVITKDTNYVASAAQGFVTAAGTSWLVDASKPATAAVTAKVEANKAGKEAAQQAIIDAAVKAALAKQATTVEAAKATPVEEAKTNETQA